jgi:hypothetical protein
MQIWGRTNRYTLIAWCRAGCWHGVIGYLFIPPELCSQGSPLTRRVFWWNKELRLLKTSTGLLFNEAKRTRYCESQTTVFEYYDREQNKAKRSSKRTIVSGYCSKELSTGELLCGVYLRSVQQNGLYPKHLDRLRWLLSLNTGILTIQTLRHVILLGIILNVADSRETVAQAYLGRDIDVLYLMLKSVCLWAWYETALHDVVTCIQNAVEHR